MSAEGTNYINCDKGIKSWLFTLDHKRIALMYLYTLTFFFFVGGVSALIFRTELFAAGQQFLTPKAYVVLF